MYIGDRLFSENTEEVLYSVLMDEEEYALFSEFQKEFASVRKLKKLGNRVIDSIAQGSSKARGKIAATAVRNGSTKHLLEQTLRPGFDKVATGIVNHAAKVGGFKATPQMKADFAHEVSKERLRVHRALKKNGGKLGPGGIAVGL